MPYVREKTVPAKNGKTYRYYQLVEGKRVDGKVRQRVIAHLGKHDSIEAARDAAVGYLDEKPLYVQPAKPDVEEARTASVVPKRHFYHLPPHIQDAPDAKLRNHRQRLRAAARRRERKIEDAMVHVARTGTLLTDDDWKRIEEISREVEELRQDAGELSDELNRRRGR